MARRRRRELRLGLVLAWAIALSAAGGPALADEWRAARELGAPDWFELEISQRLRAERLWDNPRPFRLGADASGARTGLDQNDDILLLRTLVHARVRPAEWLTIGGELQDSRALAGEKDGFLNTTIVNPVELLQAYAQLDFAQVGGGELTLRAGRITMDVGKRRFVARNRYRNTINGFTGVDVSWKKDDLLLRGFWTMPVQRKPFRRNDLEDQDIDFDRETPKFQFWGVFGRLDPTERDSVELFLFGLHSDRDVDPPRRKRELYTPGLRVFRRAAPGALDWEWESAIQLGRSRLFFTRGATTLKHLAHFHHLEAGYTFDAPWSPRVALQYDYASGDENPNDNDNERFDTLFGARRFDFGPTSIYGAFARGNISTPGIRVEARPLPRVSVLATFRGFWLAEKRDVWVGVGVRDREGGSGRYIGSQLDLRLRWDVLPKNLRLETGYARLFAGEFIENAPNSPSRGDADYVYAQVAIGY